MPDDHLLAIPVFNEERHVAQVIGEAKRYSRHILVIDDGSTDRTPGLLQEQPSIDVVTHAENLGYGKSLADAFAYALRGGYRWLITMDCDGQHEASHIPEFVEAMRRNDADIISGTRYPNGHDADGWAPADRRRINRFITVRLNRRLGLQITDAFCGFKAYRVSALSSLKITVAGYAMPMQLWVQAARASLRVRELPVRLVYGDLNRCFGGTLDNPSVRLRYYLEVFETELNVEPDRYRDSHGAAVRGGFVSERNAPLPVQGRTRRERERARSADVCRNTPRNLGPLPCR
jgi:dolichol-phosphate mannosyltransferase